MSSESIDHATRLATYAAAGEIQRHIADTAVQQVSEADLRRAVRAGLQAQLGPVVAAEAPTPQTPSWTGRLGGLDVAVLDGTKIAGAYELKWCRSNDKVAESIWDALKLLGLTINDGHSTAAYLVYGAPESAWLLDKLPTELFDSADHDVRQLLDRYGKEWCWLLTGSKTARPVRLPSVFTTTTVSEVPLHVPTGEDWVLKSARVQAQGSPSVSFEDGQLVSP
jgi:hypothetical protein